MPNSTQPIDRKTFLRRAGSMLGVVALDPSLLLRSTSPNRALTHPDPRPGITSERVLTADALGTSRKEKVVTAYDAARAYPELFDGLGCTCGCTGNGPMHRSLLVCYETMQPTGCIACQEEAQLVGKLAKEGKQLAEIRQAVDKSNG